MSCSCCEVVLGVEWPVSELLCILQIFKRTQQLPCFSVISLWLPKCGCGAKKVPVKKKLNFQAVLLSRKSHFREYLKKGLIWPAVFATLMVRNVPLSLGG